MRVSPVVEFRIITSDFVAETLPANTAYYSSTDKLTSLFPIGIDLPIDQIIDWLNYIFIACIDVVSTFENIYNESSN